MKAVVVVVDTNDNNAGIRNIGTRLLLFVVAVVIVFKLVLVVVAVVVVGVGGKIESMKENWQVDSEKDTFVFNG